MINSLNLNCLHRNWPNHHFLHFFSWCVDCVGFECSNVAPVFFFSFVRVYRIMISTALYLPSDRLCESISMYVSCPKICWTIACFFTGFSFPVIFLLLDDCSRCFTYTVSPILNFRTVARVSYRRLFPSNCERDWFAQSLSGRHWTNN